MLTLLPCQPRPAPSDLRAALHHAQATARACALTTPDGNEIAKGIAINVEDLLSDCDAIEAREDRRPSRLERLLNEADRKHDERVEDEMRERAA